MTLRIGVVGVGRAGSARLRALRQLDGAEAAPSTDLDALLDDPLVDGVVICTPNAFHAPSVRRVLDSGRHVAVEYPVAYDPDEARALFELARTHDRILHVEHIELLSSSQADLRRRASGLGRPLGGTVSFRGGVGGWILNRTLAGTPALLAIARLHRLTDLFGDADVTDADLEDRGPGGYRLRVELEFQTGGEATLVEERAPEFERATLWRIRCEGGVLEDPAPRPPGALFLEDTRCFVDRIRGSLGPYVSDTRVVHVLELVRAIERSLGSAEPE